MIPAGGPAVGGSSGVLDARAARRVRARIHSALVAAVVVCPAAFGFELWRALSGNHLSWAYVVEWPLLLVVAIHLWRAMLSHQAPPPPDAAAAAGPSGGPTVAAARTDPGAIAPAGRTGPDDDLVAWERYLAQVELDTAIGSEDGLPGA